MTIDTVTLSVIRGRLEQIVDEMDAALFRAAFSPVIAEARDGAHGIYGATDGETVAMGRFGLPVFIGAMSHATRAVIDKANASGGFHEGDAWLLNDPYLGATHLNDIKIVRPIFRSGRHVCNLASVGHWHDVGGNVAGNYNARATDIMQEGFRTPPVKIYDRGTLNQGILDILLANARLPRNNYGDFNAQIGSLDLGERRMNELFDEFGDDVILDAMAEMNRRAERHMRDLIAEIPDGRYAFEDFIDNDGLSPEPLRVAVEITVDDEEMTLDFTGSAPVCPGPMNVSRATTEAACFVGLKHIFREVPANGGCLKPVTFVIPENSVLACDPPSPVSGYTENIMRTIDVLFGAMAKATPERVNAACFATVNVLLLSGKQDSGNEFILFTFFGGGLGGNPEGDGLSHGNAPIGMANIPPAEILEAANPVLFTNWGLRQDSAGPGEHRGGLGCVYEVELLADEATLSQFGERAKFPAFGVFGGGAGQANRLTYDQPEGPVTPDIGSKVVGAKLTRGDRVRIESPGGGGYGAPAKRDREAVRRDLIRGLVSWEGAMRDYGYSGESVG